MSTSALLTVGSIPTMNKSILFGLGNVGMGYDIEKSKVLPRQTMTHLKALAESEFFSVLAVVDLDIEKLIEAEKIYSVRAVKSLSEIEIDDKIDLLTVATHTSTHFEVLASLPSKWLPKVLLIEKPAGANYLECSQIHAWARANSIKVFVNYFRRFLPKVKDARSFVSNLELGKLISVSIEAYGTMANIFSHFMDLGLTITGTQIFCDCPKLVIEEADSKMSLKCVKCEVLYDFYGLGYPRKSCQSRICFENFQIEIDSDGMEIRITKRDGDELICFKTSEDVYLNYQQIVYSSIMSQSADTQYLAGMNQAIEIHRFMESAKVDHGE